MHSVSPSSSPIPIHNTHLRVHVFYTERWLSQDAMVLHDLLGESPYVQVMLRSASEVDTKRRPSKERAKECTQKDSKVDRAKRVIESRYGASPAPPTSPLNEKRLGGRLAHTDSDDEKPAQPMLSADDEHRSVKQNTSKHGAHLVNCLLSHENNRVHSHVRAKIHPLTCTY